MTNARIDLLRASLRALGVEGFVLPRADEHLGEYVSPSAERLAWLTGFTGSAGLAVVLLQEAAVFTDGRYVLQLAAQTDPAVFHRLHITEQPPQEWAAERAKRLGYDPWLLSGEALERWQAAGLHMVPLRPNPVDSLWNDRPAPPAASLRPHPLGHAGQDSAAKRQALAETLRKAKQDACVLNDPASIAWLLNIRGDDLPFTPVALCFAILHADASVELFVSPGKLSPAVREWLGPEIACADMAGFSHRLGGFGGKTVRVDPAAAPAAIAAAVRDGGGTVVSGTDPCLLPKACKNHVEQAGARAAHARDAVALCRFLYWLHGARGETELSIAARLLAFRRELPRFRGESFPAISGAGEHGAVIHYRVTTETDRTLRENEVYLCDSGAQFEDGTTDVTRTVWSGPAPPPPDLRERYTRVLKGNIALAVTAFPQGVAGPHLDAVARRALWAAGLDYDHGTGHGVGSYLSVHEGPVSFSRAARVVAVEAGMILSDEPGFYAPGQYGIRLENLLLVQPADFAAASKPFLRFEVLTLAPFDRRLIDLSLLDAPERRWLDAYHARVLREVSPHLPADAAAWLAAACSPLTQP